MFLYVFFLLYFQARLGGAEERVRASSAHLLQLEASKKDVEHKLSSIGSTLRRIAGKSHLYLDSN